ncbi:hypothetical protein [Desulfatibacillum aliphaticivorans]|uniref:hypothetical protein n=1 Tax=Desulfatibacillum aliphaticivorans TaxID=218208 RepID=UPI0005C16C10|nr:hypothetical protein [Desulfatibacillum aliphaticivorans]
MDAYECFFDSILAADGHRRILLSDDINYRNMAFKMLGVKGIWTQTAMLFALEKKILSLKEYTDALVSLVDSNVGFISVSAVVLIQSAKDSKWRVDKNLEALFKT